MVDAVVVVAEDIDGNTGLTKIIPLEEAQLPGAPFTPNYERAAMKGAIGGLGIAYAFLIARRLIDRRVRSAKHVEEATGAAVLGVIPKEEVLGRSHRGVRGDLGRAAEAFRQLRTNLRFVDVDNEPRKIVVTSALPGEGKSTVSSNVARLVAQAGTPVLLIDADLRRPMIATTFEIDGAVGLTQALAGDVEVKDVIVDSGMTNLSLLPAGRIPPNPSELLGSLRMKQLIDELAEDYLVILDAPPLLPVTDAGLLSAFCDGALLVQASGQDADRAEPALPPDPRPGRQPAARRRAQQGAGQGRERDRLRRRLRRLRRLRRRLQVRVQVARGLLDRRQGSAPQAGQGREGRHDATPVKTTRKSSKARS